MAEERTLGLARAQDRSAEEPSKEDLQRRLDDARGSISHTVTEIRESVANQVQAVKETLDWREQFKKRPVAFTVGAAGAGFLVGYGVAALVKGDSRDYEWATDAFESQPRSYAAQPVLSQSTSSASMMSQTSENGHDEDNGPGFFERLTNSPAYEKVRSEAGSVGEALVQELSKTAKLVVVPALVKSLKDFLGGHFPGLESRDTTNRQASTGRPANPSQSRGEAGYQPVLEHNQG